MYEVPDGKLEPDEPSPVAICCNCDGGIWAWERGFLTEKGIICEDCLNATWLDIDEGLRQYHMAEAMGMEVVQFS